MDMDTLDVLIEEFDSVAARFFGRKIRGAHCHVRPRYTPGSPAMVPDETAARVAAEEKDAHEQALSGAWGESEKRRAEILGVRGVAYLMAERDSGRFERHHDAEIERRGYKRFAELPPAARAALAETGREGDYERTHWKMRPDGTWERYEARKIALEA